MPAASAAVVVTVYPALTEPPPDVQTTVGVPNVSVITGAAAQIVAAAHPTMHSAIAAAGPGRCVPRTFLQTCFMRNKFSLLCAVG